MRSAVSSILSEMSDPSPLSFPDYDQLSSDHRRVPILVRPVGNDVKTKAFARVFELISRQTRITSIGEAADEGAAAAVSYPSSCLPLEVRYLRQYALENNDWHEFQFHRGVGGVITLGTVANREARDDIAELSSLHEALRLRYSRTVLCSCLIVLRDGDGKQKESGGGGEDEAKESAASGPSVVEETRPNETASSITHVFEYENWKTLEKYLEKDLTNYLQTLFRMMLELRVERMEQDASGKVPLMCAPFERRDFVGLDLESRQNKRRTWGRFKKHLGDLSLICGYAKDAHALYSASADILRACSDWLWLANCLEGLACISVLVHYPWIQRTSGLRRNSSFQAIHTTGRRELEAAKQQPRQQQLESLRPVVVNNNELIDMFREIVVHYSKYRHAGVIETEACIKAIHVLIEQGNLLFASEFLQNVVFINLQMNDEEKVHRFSALAKLYAEINFKRKSAFFNRVAAMRCVAPQNPNPDWKLCYQLLFRTLGGYNIDCTVQHLKGQGGWATLQIQILQELVGTARRMGDPVAATRHMAFIIQNLDRELGPSEKADLCQQLNVLMAKAPGTSILHTVHDGIILPAVNLYTVPVVEKFAPRPMLDALVPFKHTRANKGGPFLFTPIVSSSKKSKIIQWVAGETCEVEVELRNPLRSPVDVKDLTILHDGAEMEAKPMDLSLQEMSTATVRLTAVPKEAGNLTITGYSLVVFGMKSQCRLKSIPHVEDSFSVEVCPPIPRLEMASALQERCVEHHGSSSEPIDIEMYFGERYDFQTSLLNVGGLPAEDLESKFTTVPARFKEGVRLVSAEDTRRLLPGEQVDSFYQIDGERMTGSVKKEQNFVLQVNVKYYSTATALEEEANDTTGDSSGAEKDGDCYYRQIIQKFNVSLRPSLVVTWWDILPGGSTEECYVILDISNETDFESELVYGDKKRIMIDSHGTCRIPFPIAKAKPPSTSPPASQPPSLDDNAASDLQQVEFLRRYLEEQVRLEWSFGGSSSTHLDQQPQQRRGAVCLPNIPLTESMVACLTSSSISTEIEVNGDAWRGVDLGFDSGAPLTIRVTGENNYSSKVRLGYKVKCSYVTWTTATGEDEDEDGGDVTNKKRHALPVSGGDRFLFCEPGASVAKSAIVLPYYPGKLLIKVSCTAQRAGELTARDEVFPDIFVNLN